MKLQGTERAVVDSQKLREYCLSPAHPRGRHKARVFASALRITQSDVEFLRMQLLEAALQSDVKQAVREHRPDFVACDGRRHA